MRLQRVLVLAIAPFLSVLADSDSEHAQPHPNNDLSNPSSDVPLPLDQPSLDNSSISSSSLENNILEDRQVAAGGGIAVTTLAPSQYPISTTAGSLFTLNGVTSATWKLYVQTFATTALGTWALGPTPGVGTIGLGTIQGTVGKVAERAVETPAPESP